MKRRTMVGSILAGAVLSAVATVNALNPSFYLAQKLEVLRNRYTQNIVQEEFGELPEYAKGVHYVESEDNQRFRQEHDLGEDTWMYTEGGDPREIGQKTIRSEVYVLPKAFESKGKVKVASKAVDVEGIQSDDDFRNTLVDHEIEGHANYYFNGFPEIENSSDGNIDDVVMDIVDELSAMRNEIRSFERRGVSQDHIGTVRTRYVMQYAGLWDARVESNLYAGIDDRLKDLFFEDWMRNSNILVRDSGEYFIINPKNGERLSLPKTVQEKLGGF